MVKQTMVNCYVPERGAVDEDLVMTWKTHLLGKTRYEKIDSVWTQLGKTIHGKIREGAYKDNGGLFVSELYVVFSSISIFSKQSTTSMY